MLNKLMSMLLAVFAFVFITSAPAFAEQPKTEVIYFYGAECPHCQNLKPWLDSFEEKHRDIAEIYRYEFWHNASNAEMFKTAMNLYGVPENEAGAPAVVVNGKVLIGTKDIEEQLEKEIMAERESKASAGVLSEMEIPVSGGSPAAVAAESGLILPGGCEQQVKETPGIASVTAAALADSVNPCAMMVLIILLSSLTVMQKTPARIAATAAAFVLAAYMTYFLIGIGLTQVIQTFGMDKWIVTAVGGIAVAIGLAELKDAFFYRSGGWAVEIPDAWRNRLNKLILSVASPAGAFLAGAAVTFFELPCTGGPYLFGISLISQVPDAERYLLLAYYNMIFILPLVLIAAAVVTGSATIEKAEAFRNEHIKAMHFIIGVIMLSLGIWALFVR